MASAAEQMAANLNWGAFSKANELKQRLLFTLGALIVFRLLVFIPLPGIDLAVYQARFENLKSGVLGMLNMFSGGALEQMSVVALNIMPYITASIIVQLMTNLSPSMAQLKKEGEAGRKKINQYTRYGTVFLALIQGYGIATSLWNSQGVVFIDSRILFTGVTMITLLGGTMFLMWLGEQITARGVGNGSSLIIFAGIVAALPRALAGMFDLGRTGGLSPVVIIGVILLVAAIVIGIVFMERAQRRILIHYPKRQTAQGFAQGDSSHLPLKLNTAGVIPPIFASSLLLMPLSIAQFMGAGATEGKLGGALSWVTTNIAHGKPAYMVAYVFLIVFFCFFYTAIVFNPDETSDNLKKNGGFIPGYRPGANTSRYLEYVLDRITVVGATYLAMLCVIPEFLMSYAAVPFYFGGTSLLIVVNVTMDTVSQIQGHLLAHQYQGLIKKAKLRTARR
jgi:preprotein translocase subunit SecY